VKDYKTHPRVETKAVAVEMEFDEESNCFVSYVRELLGMSTFGKTKIAVLNNTAEMIRGYIKSVEANRNKIPLIPAKLSAQKELVGMR
jgi:predicted RNase H-like HicB family nuclease